MSQKNRTEVMRVNPQLKKFVKDLQMKKLMKEKRITPTARITLAIFNQYIKYPELIKELEKAELK